MCNFWNHVFRSGFETSHSWWILLFGKNWCNNGFFSPYLELWWEVRTLCPKVLALFMEEILHQLRLVVYLIGFYTFQVVSRISEPSTVGAHMLEDFSQKWFTPKYHRPWNSGLTSFVWNVFLDPKYCIWSKYSDLTRSGPPNGGEIPCTSANLGWWNITIWPEVSIFLVSVCFWWFALLKSTF